MGMLRNSVKSGDVTVVCLYFIHNAPVRLFWIILGRNSALTLWSTLRCHLQGLNLPPSAREMEVKAASYEDDMLFSTI